MATKKRRAVTPPQGREFKLRIPEDVSTRIEQKARSEGRPMNRVIINELAQIPFLENQALFGESLKDLQVILARYGARITAADLTDEVLTAIDLVLNAEPAALPAAIDKLRVARALLAQTQSGQHKG